MPHKKLVDSLQLFAGFTRGSVALMLRGNRAYWMWLAFLGVLIVSGALAWARQLQVGLGLTAMRDQVSWGFYIGNFTFLVGVAAAAVVLVIPAYVYNWKPIREIVIYGELLAISAIAMCLMFVLVDIGRPERFWHLIPPFGHLNFPRSVLAWDVMVLNLYFGVNFVVATHILYRAFHGKSYIKSLVVPLVLLSIPMAVGIHTVTAFLYNGLAARPYWNSSILAPQFLASAFCSGPAILLVVLQLLRRFTRFEIQDAAIRKIAELMAYAMFLNLFLHGAEAFKEFYSGTQHLLFTRYWYFGVNGHTTLVPYAWSAVVLNVVAFVLFVSPSTRRNIIALNLGCLATYGGCYIEKGMGLIIPGLTPDALGEIYEYYPTVTELRVAAGIFAVGFLLFTAELAAMPAELDRHLFNTPQMQAIRGRFYPYYLDDSAFRTPGYIGVGAAVVLVVLFVWFGLPAWWYARDVSSHPVVKRVALWGDPLTTAVEARREADSTPRYKGGGWRVGDKYLIRRVPFAFDLLRLSDLLWAYKKVTKHSVNFIPTGKTYAGILACYGGAAEVTGNEKNVDALLAFAGERAPWAILGYSDDLKKLFKQKTQDFCAAVEQRKRELASQAHK